MELHVEKSVLDGSVHIPGSKSHTIRAVAIASLADGKSALHRPLSSSDTLSAAHCYKALGAQVDISNPQVWTIDGNGGRIAYPDDVIDVGNSGTTLRIALGSACLSEGQREIQLTGDQQIQSRPVHPLLKSLNDLGATAFSIKDNGCAPVSVQGTLRGGSTQIECFTSQYLTSLLMAAPLAENDTDIAVSLLNEPDYVRITLDWLDEQNIQYECDDDMTRFHIPGGQRYIPFDRGIPADFSSATFFLCAAAILDADVTLYGLDFSDSQPDKAVVEYLQKMGADITVSEQSVRIQGRSLHGAEIDMNRTPDALPAMAVTAAFAEGTARLFNVPQARKKETDRIACMTTELKKLGAEVEELPDGLIIRGGRKLHGRDLHGWHDHRIVMALSIAGMMLDGQTCIDTAEAMNVTFPGYVELMTSLGARMKTMP